jgi:hypothetical protein
LARTRRVGGVEWLRGWGSIADAIRPPARRCPVLERGVLILVISLGVSAGEAAGGDEKELRKKCGEGDVAACRDLAELLTGHQTKQGPARDGVESLLRACETGQAASCNNLGVQFLRGSGVAEDKPEAARLFEKACEAGSAAGCMNAGGMHVGGEGIPRDVNRGAELFRKACDGGERRACHRLTQLETYGILRTDLDRWGEAGPPPGSTLEDSPAAHAVALREWFSGTILIPAQYRLDELLVSPEPLAEIEVRANHSENGMLVVEGHPSFEALPPGLKATEAGRYKRYAHAYLFAADGSEVWSKSSPSQDVYVSASSGETTTDTGEAHPHGFAILARYAGELSGHTLVVIVYGSPISVGDADAGGPVVLGAAIEKH